MINVLMTLSKTFYKTYPVFEVNENLDINATEFLTEDKPITKEEVIKNIKDKEVYVVTGEPVDKEVIDSARNLKLVVKYGVGVDNIDVDYLTKKKIPVTNAPGQNKHSVADLTVTLLLCAARHVPQAYSLLKNNGWNLFIGNDLNEKVVGIIGLGAIGKEVAKRCNGFGMKIIAYDMFKDMDYAQKMGIEYVELDQLIKESDFITLSCASTEETYHLIDKSKLNQMKKDCIIINTSRGSVVNESDLIYALENNIIKGAALDVFDSEPPNRRLIDLDNVIATPHIGGSTYEAAKNIGEITYDNLNRFINGNELRYVINHKELGLNLIR